MNILNYGKIQCKFCAHNIRFPPLRKFFPQTCGSHILFFSQVSKSPHLLRLLSFSSKLFGLTNQGFLFLFAFDVLCCFFLVQKHHFFLSVTQSNIFHKHFFQMNIKKNIETRRIDVLELIFFS